jgi:hypothetical protein
MRLQFAQYLHEKHIGKIPASWVETGSESKITNGITTNGAKSNGVATNGASYNGYSNGTGSSIESYLDGKAVRTVYGPVPLKYALDWPVFASYDELSACAAWMGGRIPTFEEARSLYEYANHLKTEQAEHQLGLTVPAVNG